MEPALKKKQFRKQKISGGNDIAAFPGTEYSNPQRRGGEGIRGDGGGEGRKGRRGEERGQGKGKGGEKDKRRGKRRGEGGKEGKWDRRGKGTPLCLVWEEEVRRGSQMRLARFLRMDLVALLEQSEQCPHLSVYDPPFCVPWGANGKF